MAFDPNLGYVPTGRGYAPEEGSYAPLEDYYRAFNPETGQKGPVGYLGSNPYPNLRYGYSGGQYDVWTGSPRDNLYMGYPEYSGNAIDAMAQNDRNLALYGGMRLGQNLQNYTNFQYGQAANQQEQLNSAWENIARGGAGYTDEQKQAILNNPYLQSLRTSQAQQDSNYLTPEEQQGIYGNPYAASDYAQQQGQNISGLYSNFADQVGYGLDQQNQNINGQLGAGAGAMRNSIYDNRSKQYQNLSDIAALTRGAQDVARSTGEGAVNQLREDVYGQLGPAEQAARQYVDPTALNISQEYSQNYGVSPRDMQNIQDKAGRTVGAQSAMDEENLMQRANAQGNTSPLAMSAMRDRIRQTGAVNQANAMSDAAIQAKQLQLGVTQQRENTRLGAAQQYAGLGAGTELALGQRRLAAAQNVGQIGVNAELGLGTQGLQNEQYMGSNTLGTQAQLGQAQLGAEQYLSGQQQQAQQYMGTSYLNNTQKLLDTGMQQGEFTAGLGTSALQGAEAAASGRAGAVAGNRQGTNQYNQGTGFQQGQYIYDRGSQANLGFANTQQTQEQAYRDYLARAQAQSSQNTQVGQQQQLGLYGAQNQGQQGATRNAITNYAVPGFGQTVFKDVVDFIGAVTGAGKGGGGTGPHARGGEIKGPETALVGEAGPELILNFDKNTNCYGLGTGLDDVPGDDIPDEQDQQIHDSYFDPTPPRGRPLAPENPLWKRIIRRVTSTPDESSQQPGQSQSNGLGLLGSGLKGLIGLAEGGVVNGGRHYFGSQKKLHKPTVELVKGPQIRRLGEKGPSVVVPLIRRPQNKVNVSDLPKILKKYGNYGK